MYCGAELADASVYALGRRFVCTHPMAAHLCLAAIFKVRRQVKNSIPSIDAYLLEEHPCQISSRSDLKRWSLRLFEVIAPTRRRRRRTTTTTTTTRWVAIWDQFLIQKHDLRCAQIRTWAVQCRKIENVTDKQQYIRANGHIYLHYWLVNIRCITAVIKKSIEKHLHNTTVDKRIIPLVEFNILLAAVMVAWILQHNTCRSWNLELKEKIRNPSRH